jgi:hypothetical protein
MVAEYLGVLWSRLVCPVVDDGSSCQARAGIPHETNRTLIIQYPCPSSPQCYLLPVSILTCLTGAHELSCMVSAFDAVSGSPFPQPLRRAAPFVTPVLHDGISATKSAIYLYDSSIAHT